MTPVKDANAGKGGKETTLTEAAREARNAYKRSWYKQNPEKRREYMDRYWQRKAEGLSDKKKTEESRREEAR